MLHIPNRTFISPFDKKLKIQFYKDENNEIKIEDEKEFKYYKGTYILVGDGLYDINPSFIKHYDCIYITRHPIDFKNLYYMKIYYVNDPVFSHNIPTNIWSYMNIKSNYKKNYIDKDVCSITSMLKIVNINDYTKYPLNIKVYPSKENRESYPYILSLSYLGKT